MRRSVTPFKSDSAPQRTVRRSINERGLTDDDLVELALSNQLALECPRSNTGDGHQTLDAVFFDFRRSAGQLTPPTPESKSR